MPPSQPITETMILHLKEGISLENVNSGSSPAVQKFMHLTDIVKSQRGFKRQFWGHQVEDPYIFVWSIDWESMDYHIAFVNSEEYSSFLAGMSQVFDLEIAAPFTIYTRFTSDATVALASPVTEVAFFTAPNDAREEAKTLIENDSISSTHPVITVGKSTGGAMGWVFDANNIGNAVPDGESLALHGVFGYASVDDHVKWRATPEHAQVLEEMAQSPLGNVRLGDPNLPGGNIFVPDSSMFHVMFRAGI